MSVPSCCPFEDLVKIAVEWKSADLIRIQELHAASPCQHAPLKEIMLTGIRYEQSCKISPLFIAIEEGDLEMIKLIIELWGVNIHAASLDTFLVKPPHSMKLLTFENVSPLFAASLYKHFDIVSYLVEQHGVNISAGASINATDEDNEESWVELTPLHAAFLLLDQNNDDRSVQLDIIQFLVDSKADPNVLSSNKTFLSRMVSLVFSFAEFEGREIQLNKWINPNAISLLIQLGMSVTQKCPQNGTTVLHNVARTLIFDHVDAFVNLLVEKEADLQARDTSGFTPIMSAADGNGWVPNITFLNCLLDRKEIPIKDKIEALEIAAAVLLGDEMNDDLFDIAFDYLTRARNVRNQENLLLTFQPERNDRATEWITSTFNEEDIDQRFDEFPMQSILIRLRIFSALSWRAVYRYLWQPYISLYYFDQLNIENLNELDISLTMLETIRRFGLHEEGIWITTVKVVSMLARTFRVLRRTNDPLYNVENLTTSFDLVSVTYQINLESDGDDSMNDFHYYYGLINLISMMAELLPNDTIENKHPSIHHIVSQNGRCLSMGTTLLHMACFHKLEADNLLAVIKLLLKNRANPYAVCKYGRGALHHLAHGEMNRRDINAAARLLLDMENGLHLDQVDKALMTAADIYKEINPEAGDLPDWLQEGVPKLICLSSRVIQHNTIPYSESPVTLHPFVEKH